MEKLTHKMTRSHILVLIVMFALTILSSTLAHADQIVQARNAENTISTTAKNFVIDKMVIPDVPDGTPLTHAGYLDFSYDDLDIDMDHPTGEKPESKLWWNDGYWWGSMYNRDADAYHIYRFQWGSQTWVDTGTKLDDIRDPLDPKVTKADTLWDAATNKLYVVSHVFSKHPAPVNIENFAHLFRFSYDAISQLYMLDDGFPVVVNGDKSETLMIDKDSTGRLWTTHVSRPSSNGTDYQVYVNTSAGGGLANDSSWGTPFTIPGDVTYTHVTSDDISTLIAYDDKIAVLWTNQDSGNLNLAVHFDGSSPTGESNWTHSTLVLPIGTNIDDHLSLKTLATTPNGQLFAAVKLQSNNDNDPGIGVVALDSDLSLSFHTYSTQGDKDTRPIAIVNEDENKLYVFVSGKEGGSKICYKTLNIPDPGQLHTMGDFPAGNCGTSFIEDDIYKDMNNATSRKGNATDLTGIVILAGDNDNGKYYAHNAMGDPPPVVDEVSPARGATAVSLSSTIEAAFSKDMNATTINSSSFLVKKDGLPIAGTVTYDALSRSGKFTPSQPLTVDTTYIVELTNVIKGANGTSLGEGIDMDTIRESWLFTTGMNVCAPPTAVTDVTISTDGTDITLNWTGTTLADQYEVWWGTNDPYFEPDNDCSSASNCAIVIAPPEYDHAQGASDTDSNYAYIVNAVHICGIESTRSGNSNRTGEFDFKIIPGMP